MESGLLATTATPGRSMRSSATTPFELGHGCAHRFPAEFTFEGTELVYCDPPYLKRTRRSTRPSFNPQKTHRDALHR